MSSKDKNLRLDEFVRTSIVPKRRHALATCIVLFLVGCSSNAKVDEPYVVQVDEPYVVQVDCANLVDYVSGKSEGEQVVVLWYSDGTSKQEFRPGRCLQNDSQRVISSP